MQNSSNTSQKIVSNNEFQKIREKYRKLGLRVVHCHGAFDLLHPGHISHLEEAKSAGDILAVSITSAPYINKGPGRPYFSDEQRMRSLAALSCVDYVLLAEEPTAMGILEVIKPDLYVKGSEYADPENDVTQNIQKEVEKVRSNGGDIFFTGGEIFSSTKLINNNFPVFPPKAAEFAKRFSEGYTFEEIRKIIEDMQDLKILVVGDIIIDEYIFCSVQGLMSKDMAFSVRYQREERYLGGSLAVARHIANFSNNVTVCSMVGSEARINEQIIDDLGGSMNLDLISDLTYKTIVKRRFITQKGIRSEYEKLLSINYLNENEEDGEMDRSSFYKRLRDSVKNYDMVVVTDFGHGLIDNKVMEILQENSRFMAVNCQTNSSNFGMNIITKYKRADMFTLDERELRLAFRSRSEKPEKLLPKLLKQLNATTGWVTLGSQGAFGIDNQNNSVTAPALTLTVQDTIGAGDAYFALASLCACMKLPVEVGSFIGSIAGALSANIIGNSKSISKLDVLKFATTLLKF